MQLSGIDRQMAQTKKRTVLSAKAVFPSINYRREQNSNADQPQKTDGLRLGTINTIISFAKHHKREPALFEEGRLNSLSKFPSLRRDVLPVIHGQDDAGAVI
jgi:hypothetical protein